MRGYARSCVSASAFVFVLLAVSRRICQFRPELLKAAAQPSASPLLLNTTTLAQPPRYDLQPSALSLQPSAFSLQPAAFSVPATTTAPATTSTRTGSRGLGTWTPGKRFPTPQWLRIPAEPHAIARVPRNESKPCPARARVSKWNGRIGNYFHQISQAIVFAKLCNIGTAYLPPKIVGPWMNMAGVLDPPSSLSLPFDVGLRPGVPEMCPQHEADAFYHSHCLNVNALDYRSVMVEYLRPMLSPNITSCMEAPDGPGEASELTIHLRGGDLFWPKVIHYLWAQPPCSMLKKIILEGSYKRVRVVTTNGVCLDDLRQWGASRGVSVIHHLSGQGKIHQDLCAIARARYLVLSSSTFSLSAAFLSKRLKILYRRRNGPWSTFLHSMLPVGQCDMWPGVKLLQYDTCYQDDCEYAKDFNFKCGPTKQAIEWLRGFPMEDVVGPMDACE